ncbi:hypothetical protein LEP1GSC079_0804 [Leptospira interrogans str. FPW1039]|uniref:Uncharacterized protein n=1 Tax=Leptospira interrogans str. FPW1039 TaxID=1193040 RepID=A0A0F6IHH7_LEPIR|nr:hypothetical protein LEP1GSC079_0804 [Leptospira interrogans str. FPW1039]
MWPGLIEVVRIFHFVGGATPITNDPKLHRVSYFGFWSYGWNLGAALNSNEFRTAIY